MLFILHTMLRGKFSREFENIDTPFHMEGVSMVLLELEEFVDISVDGIQ